ncbi:hypothetical protein MRB53_038320 [Persea americana]|nr:hypothetical protein MRB53_038320 [Persea americana]
MTDASTYALEAHFHAMLDQGAEQDSDKPRFVKSSLLAQRTAQVGANARGEDSTRRQIRAHISPPFDLCKTIDSLEDRNLVDPIDKIHSQYVLPEAIAQYISEFGSPPLWMIQGTLPNFSMTIGITYTRMRLTSRKCHVQVNILAIDHIEHSIEYDSWSCHRRQVVKKFMGQQDNEAYQQHGCALGC